MPAFAKAMADNVGKDGFEPPNSEEDRFTVCCRWPLGYLPLTRIYIPDANINGTGFRTKEPKTGVEPATY